MTSDEYLRQRMVETDVISVTLKPKKKTLKDVLTKGVEQAHASLNSALASVGLATGGSAGGSASGIKFEDVNNLHSVESRYPHHGH